MGRSTPYDQIYKATESQRKSWMPSQRRGKIKKKLVASCLLALTGAFCCCTCCYDGPQDYDETLMAKESFVNVDL